MQTCVVHLIRAATSFVSYQHRKSVAAALKPIYQVADAEAARVELEAFKASDLGQRHPNTVATFENAWERFTPFLAFLAGTPQSSTDEVRGRLLSSHAPAHAGAPVRGRTSERSHRTLRGSEETSEPRSDRITVALTRRKPGP